MLWILPITLIVFFSVRWVSLKLKNPLFNPLAISVIVLVGIMLVTDTPYSEYAKYSNILTDLLPYSVIALAYPLYELFPKIKKQWKFLLFITFSASFFAIISGVSIVFLLGGNEAIAASVLPKSVTTAIAVIVAEQQNGVTSIAAFSVVVAGLFGSIFGYQLLALFKIRSSEAKGLAMGAASHALGTAKALETDINDGAYSSLALVLCGIITSIIAPIVFPIMLYLFSS